MSHEACRLNGKQKLRVGKFNNVIVAVYILTDDDDNVKSEVKEEV
jgi:hypothetical protein